jgi:hypothetical protein
LRCRLSRKLLAKLFRRLATNKLEQQLSSLFDPVIGILINLAPVGRHDASQQNDPEGVAFEYEVLGTEGG